MSNKIGEQTTVKAKMLQWVPFIILFILMVAAHSGAKADFRDDVVNLGILNDNDNNIISVLQQSRLTQSGRSLIDGIMLWVLSQPIYLFRLLNPVAYVLIAFSIDRMFENGIENSKWFSMAAVLIFPASQMMACGWVTTSGVYLWPLAALIYSLSFYPTFIQGKHLNKLELFLFLSASIYAANLEQAAALIIGFSSVAILGIWLLSHRIVWECIIQLIGAVIAFSWVCLAPGNAIRMHAQVVSNMPDFYHKSLLNKFVELFNYTNQEYLFGSNCAIILLCSLSLYIIWLKHKAFIMRMIGLFPVIIVFALGPLNDIFVKAFPVLNINNTYNAENIYQISNFVGIIIGVLTWGCIIISLYMVFHDIPKLAWSSIIILVAGLASRMVLVATPSYLASGYRTSIFLYFSILVLILLLIQEMNRNKGRYNLDIVAAFISVVAVCNYIAFCLSV